MKATILDTTLSLITFIRLRWMFLAAVLVALGFLTAAALMENLGLAMIGAIAAFGAGEEKASQALCNDCATEMVLTSVEIPEHYPAA